MNELIIKNKEIEYRILWIKQNMKEHTQLWYKNKYLVMIIIKH